MTFKRKTLERGLECVLIVPLVILLVPALLAIPFIAALGCVVELEDRLGIKLFEDIRD